MDLVEYGRSEMKRAGLYDSDSDYNGGVARSVEQILKLLSRQGHSGSSHRLVLSVLERVALFRPLTALTADPEEWMEVQGGMWQSRRLPSAFSTDGGVTYYDLDEPKTDGEHVIHRSA